MSSCTYFPHCSPDVKLILCLIAQNELSNPPSDAISAIKYGSSSKLLVASWDKNVYLYDTPEPGGALLQTFEHRAPVLDVCFGENDDEAFSAGLDWDVKR